jgi:uncharacterized protein
MSEEIFYPSGGLKCAADLYLPAGTPPAEGWPGLVIGHGFSLVKSMLVSQATYFQEAGFAVIAIDYRSFGNSEGEIRGQLFPLNMVEDYRNGISYMQARPDVNADRIGIWGTSFAGALSTYVAAVDRRVKATVSQVPVTDGHTWMKLQRNETDWVHLLDAIDADRAKRLAGEPGDRMPAVAGPGDICGIPGDDGIQNFFVDAKSLFPTWSDTLTVESAEKIIEFSPLSMVDRISPRPYMIISTSGYDIIHPADTVADLYARAREPKRIEWLPYDQTGLYSDPGMTEAHKIAADFFKQHLT